MRIIRGKFRNKKLFFPKNLKTRPLKDSVKENIFNILEHSPKLGTEVNNANILDLYAGSGSFGFECISRNALEVTFDEKDNDALESIKKNIKNLKTEKKTKIFSSNVNNYLKGVFLKRKFDIIFFDPPFENRDFVRNLGIIIDKNIFSDKHIIIIHREKGSDKSLSGAIKIIEKRIYGRSEIFFGKLS